MPAPTPYDAHTIHTALGDLHAVAERLAGVSPHELGDPVAVADAWAWIARTSRSLAEAALRDHEALDLREQAPAPFAASA